MKRRLAALVPLLASVVALSAAPAGAKPPPSAPPEFFGISPQTALTDKDAAYMRAGHIGALRIPVSWPTVQPSASGGYNWAELDQIVAMATRAGLRVLPFFYGTPRWLARKPTTLPIDSAKARKAWVAFVEAAVKRYGPGGEFWARHSPASAAVNYEPAIPTPAPIRTWQIWNEANFFYFAYPASPGRYARLLKLSSPAIKGVDPGAKVVLTGLFGKPNPRSPRGMPAARFLEALYRVPGIKSSFDGVALHPYAVDTETLEELVEEFHQVTTENHDRVGLYITEMGWGSQNDFQHDAFEQGIQGQVRQLRGAYTYLLENRNRLDLKQVYWYSWKDNPAYVACDFCDSVGLFRAGKAFKPKPAWHAFVALSGGRARP
jgi:hypothetical protein